MGREVGREMRGIGRFTGPHTGEQCCHVGPVIWSAHTAPPLFHLVKYYNPVSNLCIVRCSRDEHQQVQFLGPTCSTTTSVFIAALNESHQLMPLYHLY